MALLAEAIRASDTQAAVWRSPQGGAVYVKRVTGREGPYDQEEYAIYVKMAVAPAQNRIAALDLVEALESMRDLGLPDFDPDGNTWEPAHIPDPDERVTREDREDFLTL